LRAFNYLRTAEFFMNLQDDRKLDTYTKAREAFIRAIQYFDEKPLQIEVPFEGSFLPGYLFKPAGVKNPPVMVMFGGLDSLAESLGIAMVADVILSIFQNEEDLEMGVIRLGMIKNRFGMRGMTQAMRIAYATLTIYQSDDDEEEIDDENNLSLLETLANL
jgi:alkanesulfonate monooxygenase SsuD/methylene tetrahydromethanopterin reductase-like flavin-dependent oxidoreductase (luciferase family)